MHITTETSREFARKRQADGVGTAMVNRSLACLRRMLRIAHEDGRIQHVPKIRFLKEPPPRKGFLELEKFNELLALLPTHLRPLILLLYYCGLRVDEGRQIEWTQVDLDARLIASARRAAPRPLFSCSLSTPRRAKSATGCG